MWSSSVGAEVMKPLATPVLGGMVSSLLHVLIVTPVIYFWIHERRLGLREARPAADAVSSTTRRRRLVWVLVAVLALGGIATWRLTRGPGADTGRADAGGTVVQSMRSDDLEIVLLSPTGTLRTGRSTFTIEFRSPSGDLTDVGAVQATANMAMPGMLMSGNLQVNSTGVPGRYAASAEFGMAGAWQMSVAWDGPAGRRSVAFQGNVQ
jgi:Cu(I)/Ag(I) efflux system membrane protein CusA/SilA